MAAQVFALREKVGENVGLRDAYGVLFDGVFACLVILKGKMGCYYGRLEKHGEVVTGLGFCGAL